VEGHRSHDRRDGDTLGPLLADAALVAEVVEQTLYDFEPVAMESVRSAYAAAVRVEKGLRGRTFGPALSAEVGAEHPL
jgi:hypothetical protein